MGPIGVWFLSVWLSNGVHVDPERDYGIVYTSLVACRAAGRELLHGRKGKMLCLERIGDVPKELPVAPIPGGVRNLDEDFETEIVPLTDEHWLNLE